MNQAKQTTKLRSKAGAGALLCLLWATGVALGQTRPAGQERPAQAEHTTRSTGENTTRRETTTATDRTTAAVSSDETGGAGPAAGDTIFAPLYRNFYDTYRLGPGDVLALRVAQQPDYTVDRAKVSPVGRVYHPLLGDFEVAGLTVGQVLERFTRELNEYLLNPKVSVELVEANSAKIGVLGDVKAPGIIVMARPMTVLEAITAAGGFADTGSRSNVALLRPEGGRLVETKIDLKRVLEGKTALTADLTLRAGDTLLVRGNTRKKIVELATLVGFAQFVAFLTRY